MATSKPPFPPTRALRAGQRRRWVTVLCGWSVCLGLLTPGCQLFETPDASERFEKLLHTAKPPSESVALEVLLVLVPDKRREYLEQVWLHADEQVIGAGTRRELARNGLRVGVIGPAWPDGLAELLQTEASPKVADGGFQSISVEKTPTITGGMKFRRPHQRMEITAPAVSEELRLFFGSDSGVTGDVYEDAQGVYAVQWSPLPQGRIEVELTPELQHGRLRKQYAPGEGNDLRFKMDKSREIFEELRVRAPLSAGQMLLISGDLTGSGSLGHHFHTLPSADGPQHRLVLIRLAQVPNETL